MTDPGRPILAHPSAGAGQSFIWAAGIEDTFIAAPHPVTGRILDEYALTEHYDRWEEDLQLIAGLGVSAARYGIPWYRVNPRPGEFDWSWTDGVIERPDLAANLGCVRQRRFERIDEHLGDVEAGLVRDLLEAGRARHVHFRQEIPDYV